MLTFIHQTIAAVLLITLISGVVGCASKSGWEDPGFIYAPKAFKAALRNRAPQLTDDQLVVPFSVSRKAARLAREKFRRAPKGLDPVQLLVAALSDPSPEGLGIEYDWSVSATANRTLELGRGDCVSLAMLLVGLGRSLDWPIYFAEARPENPVIHQFRELTVLSSHMVVMVLTREGPVMVDFLGLIDKSEYQIHPIDDLAAYAHLVNNVSGHQIAVDADVDERAWDAARARFELVTQIQPKLGRGWNNLGIAYTRLGRYDEARSAYSRAMALDTAFGSPSRNLTIMETRAAHTPTIVKRSVSD